MPLIITEIGCSDDDPDISTAPTENTAETFSSTSTINDNHSHTITIQLANVDNPPVDGNTITSSENSSHDHTITLTQKQFQQLAEGETLIVFSSNSSGSYLSHTHSFSIKVP